jgi:hypothetical protein
MKTLEECKFFILPNYFYSSYKDGERGEGRWALNVIDALKTKNLKVELDPEKINKDTVVLSYHPSPFFPQAHKQIYFNWDICNKPFNFNSNTLIGYAHHPSNFRFISWKNKYPNRVCHIPLPCKTNICYKNKWKSGIWTWTGRGAGEIFGGSNVIVSKILEFVLSSFKENRCKQFIFLTGCELNDDDSTKILYQRIPTSLLDSLRQYDFIIRGGIHFDEILSILEKSEIAIPLSAYDQTLGGSTIEAALHSIPTIGLKDGGMKGCPEYLSIPECRLGNEYISMLNKLTQDESFYLKKSFSYYEHATFHFSYKSFYEYLLKAINDIY